MAKIHLISSEKLTLEKLQEIISNNFSLALSKESKAKIIACRKYLNKKISNSREIIYGVNTGFGSLCNVKISNAELQELQVNLVMSHACGTGEEVQQDIVKLMMLLKIQSLSYGNSGISLEVVERLIDFYNNDILPIVYEQGSLGASGDLIPLAHLSLPLIGMGEVNFNGEKISSEKILKQFKWKPLSLKAKDGLALLNGTQFMSAYGIGILLKANRISYFADLISAISIDAFDCRLEPFDELIHKIRPHKGQIQTAKNIIKILKGSKISERKKEQVQDPYSFRCIPQVHGASKDAIEHCTNIFLTEINSVSDNPSIFPEEDKVISGGNFHGQPLALALDYLCIALAELGNISERRIYQLLIGQRGLPTFLIKNGGLNSGFMIPQYLAASLVSQNKQLCTPASVDSIVSSNGQEDHVSMGANAATKCFKVAINIDKIFAIELLNASQALEFRRPLKSSPTIEKIIVNYRKHVLFLKSDRFLYEDIQKTIFFITNEFII